MKTLPPILNNDSPEFKAAHAESPEKARELRAQAIRDVMTLWICPSCRRRHASEEAMKACEAEHPETPPTNEDR